MEQHRHFPRSVCSPKAIPCFLAFGFHEVEWRQTAALYACPSPTGCEGDLDRIFALAQAGVTLPADIRLPVFIRDLEEQWLTKTPYLGM